MGFEDFSEPPTLIYYSFCRIAKRDTTKRKYEQKQEEKINSIRERTSAMKEKEKVCFVSLNIRSI